jgi:hypothetical protein
MTDYNDNSKLKHDPESNMEALKTAIVNGEEQQLKALLTNLLFDGLQKSYLISLAEHRGNPEIVSLLKGAPAKP